AFGSQIELVGVLGVLGREQLLVFCVLAQRFRLAPQLRHLVGLALDVGLELGGLLLPLFEIRRAHLVLFVLRQGTRRVLLVQLRQLLILDIGLGVGVLRFLACGV